MLPIIPCCGRIIFVLRYGVYAQFEVILPEGPYLPCVSMPSRARLAGYHRIMHPYNTVLYRCHALLYNLSTNLSYTEKTIAMTSHIRHGVRNHCQIECLPNNVFNSRTTRNQISALHTFWKSTSYSHKRPERRFFCKWYCRRLFNIQSSSVRTSSENINWSLEGSTCKNALGS